MSTPTVHPEASAKFTLIEPGRTVFTTQFQTWPSDVLNFNNPLTWWEYNGTNNSYSARWDAPGTGSVRVGQFSNLVVGRAYRLTLLVKADSGIQYPYFQVRNADGTGTFQSAYATVEQDFFQVEFTFNAVAANMHLFFASGYVARLWFDNITLELLPSSAGEQTLPVSEGRVTLDEGWAPYAQATITVPMDDEALVSKIDPRNPQRVKIKASVDGSFQAQPPLYGPWITQATNLAKNPRVAAGSSTAPTGYTADGTVLTVSRVDGAAFGVQYAARWTRGTTAAGSFRMAAGSTNSTFVAGQTYTVMVSIRSSVSKVFSAYMRPSVSTSTNQIAMDSINAEAGVVHNIRRTFVATGTSYGLTLTSAGAVGETLDATKVAYVEGEYTGPWFDGASGLGYGWTGTSNASASTYSIRTETPQPPLWVPSGEREFDLAIREREVNHADRTMTLNLASDEGSLIDYAPLTRDLGAFQFQSSLRGICNYVLGKVGANLQAGGPDTEFQTVTPADNMVINPGSEGLGEFQAINAQMLNETVWKPNDRKGVHIHSVTSTDSYVAIGGNGNSMAYGMSTGRTYTFSASGSVRSTISGQAAAEPDYGTGTNMFRSRAIVVHTNGPQTGYRIWHSPQVPNVANSEARVSVQFTIPDDATMVFVRLYHGGTSGSISWSNFRLTETDTRPGVNNTVYFDGSTPASALYAYTWTGAVNGSTSRRTPKVDRAPELLVWEPGVTAWDFLDTLLKKAGMRLFCDEQRKWRLVDQTYKVPGVVVVQTGVNTIEGTDTITRDANEGVWADGVVITYEWINDNGNAQSTKDVAGLPGKVWQTTFNRPYPGPGAAAYALSRFQGKGRTQDVTILTEMSATPAQSAIINLPGTVAQTGSVSQVIFDLKDGTSQLGTRGLTDTLPGSWALWNPTQTWSQVPATMEWIEAA